MAGRVRRNYGDSNQIKQDLFELMVGDGWTQQQVCDRFGVTRNTLKSWIRETYNDEIVNYEQAKERFSADLKSQILQMGMRHARKSPVAWIFLAKNMLGMTDAPSAKASDIKTREENSKSMSEAIASAAEAMKSAGIKDEDLADIPDFSEPSDEEEIVPEDFDEVIAYDDEGSYEDDIIVEDAE